MKTTPPRITAPSRPLNAQRRAMPECSKRQAKPFEHLLRHPRASRAIEREGVAQGRADLRLERFAQQLAGAVQPGLYRLRAQPEQSCGLLDAHLLDDAGN